MSVFPEIFERISFNYDKRLIHLILLHRNPIFQKKKFRDYTQVAVQISIFLIICPE